MNSGRVNREPRREITERGGDRLGRRGLPECGTLGCDMLGTPALLTPAILPAV